MIRKALTAGLAMGWLLVAVPLSAADPADSAKPMQVITLREWRTILAARRSEIVVADLWASWCVSCIERFPKMVEMADRFEGRGVHFVTLNLDDPRDRSGIDWSNDFLAGLGGPFSHYHLAENLSWSFEALDLMSLPVVLIYDVSGGERFRLSNDNPNRQFTEADVEAAVVALLAEKAMGSE
jgi:thiol-disulfide isomerase/thioredoxin